MNTNTEHVPGQVPNKPIQLFALMGIADHPFLKGMSAGHLRLLESCAMQTSFAEGRCIFAEGSVADHFYLIQDGSVRLETNADDEKEIIPVQVIGSGQVLGWSWLFPPYEWQFGARAMEPVNAIVFYAEKLRGLCEQDHDLGYELLKRVTEVMLERLQATRMRLWVVSEACRKLDQKMVASN